MSDAITIQGIHKRFATVDALKSISFSVLQGEFFALLGPNGAGKTTLISMMAGLTLADKGTLKIMGHDVVRDFRQARRCLGVVPQELVFDPFLTTRETLQFQSGYFGLRHNNAWIDELLFKLGLQDKANSNMRALSGGMKRRVMVAQALVHRPPVIVLDEPTAGVDVELRQSLWTFVRELNRQGHTIVLTTHYLEEAQALCNRVAMLKKGQLIALENKSTLLQHRAERDIGFKLTGALPQTLESKLVTMQPDHCILRLNQFAELEEVLTQLRLHHIQVREMWVIETDLESVFVKMMNEEAP